MNNLNISMFLDLHARYRKFWLISRGSCLKKSGPSYFAVWKHAREGSPSKWQFEIGGKLRQVCQQEWWWDSSIRILNRVYRSIELLMAAFDGWCDFHFRSGGGASHRDYAINFIEGNRSVRRISRNWIYLLGGGSFSNLGKK